MLNKALSHDGIKAGDHEGHRSQVYKGLSFGWFICGLTYSVRGNRSGMMGKHAPLFQMTKLTYKCYSSHTNILQVGEEVSILLTTKLLTRNVKITLKVYLVNFHPCVKTTSVLSFYPLSDLAYKQPRLYTQTFY